MLDLDRATLDEIAAMAYAAYPLEGCGLLVGDPSSARVERFVRCRNVAESAKVYTLDPLEHLRAERSAEDEGLEVIGVVHSHTHSEPFPSPTDVSQVPDPTWHYVIVGLKRAAPEFRSYTIADGTISEEPITVR